ncbi:MAG: PAS domain-containing protein [Nitrospinae bacterium]|nr:PAS domain-containing protein [Nitrospinota bacterium]
MKKETIKVLLIEDEETHIELILHLLGHFDFLKINYQVARTFAEAKHSLQEANFDIILSDLSLPDSPLNETLSRLKKVVIGTPIIVLTSLDDWETVKKLVNEGASDCIPKAQLTPSLFERSIYYALERSKLEISLKESEERWEFALEGSEQGVWDWNAETNEVFFSKRWKEMLGYNDVEILNEFSEWDSRIHPDDRKLTYFNLDNHFSGKTKTYINEHRLKCKNGEYKWIIARGKIVSRTVEGKPLRVIGTHTDISVRKEQEFLLAQSENKYRTLIESLKDEYFFYSHDSKGTFTYCSPSITGIIGYSDKEFQKHYSTYLTDNPKNSNVEELTNLCLQGKKQPPYEVEIFHKDGSVKTLLVLETPILNNNQGIIGVNGIAKDITLQKETERALKESHERFESIVSHIPGAVYRCANDKDWTMEYLSDAIKEISGYPSSDFTKNIRSYASIIHPDDVSMVDDWVQKGVLQKEPFIMDYRIIHADGNVRWVSEEGQGLYNDDGTLICLNGVIIDSTEKKEKEEKMLQDFLSRKAIASILQHSLLGGSLEEQLLFALDEVILLDCYSFESKGAIFLMDKRGKNLVLKAQRNVPSHTLNECKTVPLGECICGKVAQNGEVIYSNCPLNLNNEKLEGTPEHGHYCMPIQSRNKTLGALNIYIKLGVERSEQVESFLESIAYTLAGIIERHNAEIALKDKNSELDSINANLEERVKSEVEKSIKNEQLLIQQSKMAMMGEMIGAIAHQWRQPLNCLGLIIQNIEDEYSFGEITQDSLAGLVKQGMEEINFMSDTIDDFRNFFMKSKEKALFDVETAIQKTVELSSAQFHNNFIKVIFQKKQHEPIPPFLGYQNEFKQVLVNILSNGKDAILKNPLQNFDDQGHVGQIEIRLDQHDNMVVVDIEDTGGGIQREEMEKVFEPYFTTKEEDKGTGIGLYMSKTIVEKNMGGTLTVKNGKGGAIFTITLNV